MWVPESRSTSMSLEINKYCLLSFQVMAQYKAKVEGTDKKEEEEKKED